MFSSLFTNLPSWLKCLFLSDEVLLPLFSLVYIYCKPWLYLEAEIFNKICMEGKPTYFITNMNRWMFIISMCVK